MAHPASGESAADMLNPFAAPEPATETGLGTHFGSTFAPAKKGGAAPTPISSSSANDSKNPYASYKEDIAPSSPSSKTSASSSVRPMHSGSSPPSKTGISSSVRPMNGGSSPREKFPDYGVEEVSSSRHRATSHSHHQNPPPYREAAFGSDGARPRRGSSLRERYPGDKSTHPLAEIKSEDKKAYRSPHLNKNALPGADLIDQLDPAIGGRSYHHEGPFDAALMSRNRDPKYAPVNALKSSNEEAIRATPRENIKNAVDRHEPISGVANVPPGMPDEFGRRYNYHEGTDMMHEPTSGDPGYKRWPGKDYDPEDLKGESEPGFTLDRALQAHKINDDGIEMADRSEINKSYHEQKIRGTLDDRDPVEIAGDDGKYVDLEMKNAGRDMEDGAQHPATSTLGKLKGKLGDLRHRKRED